MNIKQLADKAGIIFPPNSKNSVVSKKQLEAFRVASIADNELTRNDSAGIDQNSFLAKIRTAEIKIDASGDGPIIASGTLKQMRSFGQACIEGAFRGNIKPIAHDKNHMFAMRGSCGNGCYKADK